MKYCTLLFYISYTKKKKKKYIYIYICPSKDKFLALPLVVTKNCAKLCVFSLTLKEQC